jgi:hypothetical protein
MLNPSVRDITFLSKNKHYPMAGEYLFSITRALRKFAKR